MSEIKDLCLNQLESIIVNNELKDSTRVNAIKLLNRLGYNITEYTDLLMKLALDEETTEHARISALCILLDLCEKS